MSDPSFLDRCLIKFFKGVNKLIAWHKLPSLVGAINLLAFRIELKQKNLHDTYPAVTSQGTKDQCPMTKAEYLTTRNSDGMFNSLEQPLMGCSGMRFGRNVPREHTEAPSEEALWDPNPRVVSERLLARNAGFKPATIVNLLAACWIQFQVHDWANHEESDEKFDIPLPKMDTWPSGHMKLPKSKPDTPALDARDKKSPAYKNTNTAWWDASQLYGSSEAATSALRDKCKDGKLRMTQFGTENFLPRDAQGLPETGFASNWWIGLELLHTLFASEHNAICDMLAKSYPDWSDDQYFDTARLINCALMAKIHTVEWTPAILAHPTMKVAMNANWWGLAGEKLMKMFGRIAKGEVISGIPGSGVDMGGVPYSITEEFVSVYRLHSLIPDNIAFFKSNGTHVATTPISSVAFTNAQDPLIAGFDFANPADKKGTAAKKPISLADAFFSFGINYPGAITHNNMASFMRFLPHPDGTPRDMGTVDILRDRERGVPRYNEFRRLFHMPPMGSWEDLTGGDKELVKVLKEVYGEDGIEKVDLLVGCLCEPLPKGFGFSDTAFRVFILMASRRLESDRFIAGGGWSENVYTKEGLAWVQNTTMIDVLVRHFPELKPALAGSQNAFAPWKKVGRAGEYGGVETNAP